MIFKKYWCSSKHIYRGYLLTLLPSPRRIVRANFCTCPLVYENSSVWKEFLVIGGSTEGGKGSQQSWDCFCYKLPTWKIHVGLRCVIYIHKIMTSACCTWCQEFYGLSIRIFTNKAVGIINLFFSDGSWSGDFWIYPYLKNSFGGLRPLHLPPVLHIFSLGATGSGEDPFRSDAPKKKLGEV